MFARNGLLSTDPEEKETFMQMVEIAEASREYQVWLMKHQIIYRRGSKPYQLARYSAVANMYRRILS
jgi:hypothetical protein